MTDSRYCTIVGGIDQSADANLFGRTAADTSRVRDAVNVRMSRAGALTKRPSYYGSHGPAGNIALQYRAILSDGAQALAVHQLDAYSYGRAVSVVGGVTWPISGHGDLWVEEMGSSRDEYDYPGYPIHPLETACCAAGEYVATAWLMTDRVGGSTSGEVWCEVRHAPTNRLVSRAKVAEYAGGPLKAKYLRGTSFTQSSTPYGVLVWNIDTQGTISGVVLASDGSITARSYALSDAASGAVYALQVAGDQRTGGYTGGFALACVIYLSSTRYHVMVTVLDSTFAQVRAGSDGRCYPYSYATALPVMLDVWLHRGTYTRVMAAWSDGTTEIRAVEMYDPVAQVMTVPSGSTAQVATVASGDVPAAETSLAGWYSPKDDQSIIGWNYQSVTGTIVNGGVAVRRYRSNGTSAPTITTPTVPLHRGCILAGKPKYLPSGQTVAWFISPGRYDVSDRTYWLGDIGGWLARAGSDETNIHALLTASTGTAAPPSVGETSLANSHYVQQRTLPQIAWTTGHDEPGDGYRLHWVGVTQAAGRVAYPLPTTNSGAVVFAATYYHWSPDIHHVQWARWGDEWVCDGGVPWVWDGRRPTELGWPVHPQPQPPNLTATTGTAVDAGLHYWRITWVYRDARGNEHRSAPSAAASATSTGTDYLIDCEIPQSWRFGSSVSGAVDPSEPVRCEVWRTVVGGATYYLSGSFPVTHNTVTPVYPWATGTVQYRDQYSDAAVAANRSLYTTGDEVSHWPPGPSTGVTVHAGRVVLGGAGNSRCLYTSFARAPGEGPTFGDSASAHVIQIPDLVMGVAGNGGTLTALCATDGYQVSGDGPSRIGTPGYSAPSRAGIPGCRAPASVCELPGGVIYQSLDGSLQLVSGGAAADIGQRVYDYLHESRSAISGAVLGVDVWDARYSREARTAAIVLRRDDNTRAILLYDEATGEWVADAANGSATWVVTAYGWVSGVAYLGSTTGTTGATTALLRQESDWTTEGHIMSVTLPRMVAPPGGQGAWRRITLDLTRYQTSSGTLAANVYCQAHGGYFALGGAALTAAWSEAFTSNLAEYSFQIEAMPGQPRGQYMTVRIDDVAANVTGYLGIRGFSVQQQQARGLTRVPSTRRA